MARHRVQTAAAPRRRNAARIVLILGVLAVALIAWRWQADCNVRLQT